MLATTTADVLPLIAVSLIFSLSLLGAVVLFKFLKSSAVIEKKEHRVGGALAGFLLIFGTLDATYLHVAASRAEDAGLWTIRGAVRYQGELSAEPLKVEVLPPEPTLVASDRRFLLRNVPLSKGELPCLYIGETGQTLPITDETAEIDSNRRLIELREPWELFDRSDEAEVAGGFLDDSQAAVDGALAVEGSTR